MTSSYQAFFANYVQTFPGLGVMGVAPYLYKSSTLAAGNPLGCKSCGIGDNAQRMSSWYGGCQAYVNLSRKVTGGVDNYPSYGALLRFPDQASGSCQDDSNDIASKLTNVNYASKNFLNPQQPQLDYFAGQRSLDPVFVRAVVASESSFNPCSVAIVRSSDACYNMGYTSMTDPIWHVPAFSAQRLAFMRPRPHAEPRAPH
jgi:hypothetical protein